MEIREIRSDEFSLAWPIFHSVVGMGDSYAYSSDISFEEALALWTTAPARTFIAVAEGQVVGCYLLRPNQPGLGNHVANAGYMVAREARGRGIGGLLCEHSMEVARQAGFLAMQFNFVVSSNEVAIRLWKKYGFEIVGRVPKAFRHSSLGLTDVFVMYRLL
jgi:ribosomal protein S18 acetylase RimI-like enzyme